MVSFKHYFFLSILLTTAAVVNAVYSKKQFYNIAIYLTTHKLNIVVLGNLAFLMSVLLFRCIQKLFLGHLTRDEVEELIQNSKYAISETCLALTIFREELNSKLLFLFTTLLFVKIFHWLAALRVEYLSRAHGWTRWAHIRLQSLFGFLFLLDAIHVGYMVWVLLVTKQASVLMLFAFEYMILLVSLVSTFLKYIIILLEQRWEGRWNNKATCLFYLELSADLTRLCLYLLFFCVICVYYGLPLHLVREIGLTFYHLRERIQKFILFRKITKNMNERFPDVSQEELAAGDRTCIVCREDMVTEAKKLPCGHFFHFNCLRTWLEDHANCPTCRAEIPLTAQAPTNNNVNNNNNNNDNNAAAAAPAAAPIAATAVPTVSAAPQATASTTGVAASIPASVSSHTASSSTAGTAHTNVLHPLPAVQHSASHQPQIHQPTTSTTLPPNISALLAAHLAQASAAPSTHNTHSSHPLPPLPPTGLPVLPGFPPLHDAAAFAASLAAAGLPPPPPPPPGLGLSMPPPPPFPSMSPFGQLPFMSTAAPSPLPSFSAPTMLPLMSSFPPLSPFSTSSTLDPYSVALFQHQSLLLQHHVEFLQSCLNQARALQQQQSNWLNHVKPEAGEHQSEPHKPQSHHHHHHTETRVETTTEELTEAGSLSTTTVIKKEVVIEDEDHDDETVPEDEDSLNSTSNNEAEMRKRVNNVSH